jgi:hypothetical protein
MSCGAQAVRSRRSVNGCGRDPIRRAPAARQAVSVVGQVDGTAVLRWQAGTDVRHGGRDEALRRLDECARCLGDSQQPNVRRVHVHDRAGRGPRMSDQVQAVICVEAQVGDEQVRHSVADVLSRRHEITACRDIGNRFEHSLQCSSASDVGFDDQDSSCHVDG